MALYLYWYLTHLKMAFSIYYKDKAIFKWARYQKLRHFLESYHAPYKLTAKYRHWTGLLVHV